MLPQSQQVGTADSSTCLICQIIIIFFTPDALPDAIPKRFESLSRNELGNVLLVRQVELLPSLKDSLSKISSLL